MIKRQPTNSNQLDSDQIKKKKATKKIQTGIGFFSRSKNNNNKSNNVNKTELLYKDKNYR